eukprot:m.156615 g.156615  ORF g.156615 m.156615 type:complete len:1085 (+) comp16443_c0_seq2:159-3413(+)
MSKQSRGNRRKTKVELHEPRAWSAHDVAVWLRGVEKLPREVLEGFIHANIDGSQLLKISAEQLKELGIRAVGQQCAILAGIDALKSLNSQIKTTPIARLGTKLLQAGRSIDLEPLEAAKTMIGALTATLHALDSRPPTDGAGYLTLRARLLNIAQVFIDHTRQTLDVSASNADYVQKCKGFVRELLPELQGLRAMDTTPDGDEDDWSTHLQNVNVQVPKATSAGLSIKSGNNGFIFVSSIAQGKPVERNGMLRLGDEIIQLNDQVIVGWRTKSVAALIKQCDEHLSFTVKLSGPAYDERIAALMETARAIRNSMAAADPGRRSRGNSTSTAASSRIRAASNSHSGRESHGGGSLHPHRQSTASGSDVAASRSSQGHNNPMVKIESMDEPSEQTGGSGTGHRERVGSSSDAGLKVTNPRAGDCLTRGLTYTIEWGARPTLGKDAFVKLRLMSTQQSYTNVIEDNLPNTGSYRWVVNKQLHEGSDYQILLALTSSEAGELLAFSQKFKIIRPEGGTASEVSTVDSMLSSRTRNKIKPRRAILTRSTVTNNFGFEWDGPFISDIEVNGPAHRDGILSIGDQIAMINGEQVHGKSQLCIANMVRSCGATLEVIVIPNVDGYKKYLDGFNALHQNYRDQLVCRKATLVAQPELEAYGLSLHSTRNVIEIVAVAKGSATASNRHMTPGTSIVQINSQSACGGSTAEALTHIEADKQDKLNLIITHDASVYAEYVHRLLLLRESCVLPESKCNEIIQKASRWSLKRDSSKNGMALPRSASTGSTMSSRSRVNSRGSKGSIRQAVTRTLSFNKQQLIGRKSQTGNEIILDGTEVNIPCAMVEEPDLAGWLMKQGGSGFTPKNWRKRWFVLKQGVVLYYKQPFDDKALGSFALPGYMIMPSPPGKRMSNRFGFKIAKEGDRSYYVCAETAEDMKKWMNAMSLAAIQYSEQSIRNQSEGWDPRDPRHMVRKNSTDSYGVAGRNRTFSNPSSQRERLSSVPESDRPRARQAVSSANTSTSHALPTRTSLASSSAYRDSLASSHSSASGAHSSNVMSPNSAINHAVAAATAAKGRGSRTGSRHDSGRLKDKPGTAC